MVLLLLLSRPAHGCGVAHVAAFVYHGLPGRGEPDSPVSIVEDAMLISDCPGSLLIHATQARSYRFGRKPSHYQVKGFALCVDGEVMVFWELGLAE